MAVQTSYSNQHAPAYEGMKADTNSLFNTLSRFAEGGNIVAGRCVVNGTDPDTQCILPATDSVDADVVGFTLYELNRVHTDAGVPENDDRPLTLVTTGRVYAKAINGATAGDPVYLVINALGGTVGTLRSAATATGSHGILLSGAKWISSAAANGLAQISFNRA